MINGGDLGRQVQEIAPDCDREMAKKAAVCTAAFGFSVKNAKGQRWSGIGEPDSNGPTAVFGGATPE